MDFLKEMEIIQKFNSFLDRSLSIEIIKTRPKEAIKFAKKYFKGKMITAIEIGVLRGENSKEILKNLKIKNLYLVDPWISYEDYSKSEPERTQDSLNIDFKVCRANLKRYLKKIIWIKDYSEKAITSIKEKVDFIYVDGNHEYKYVKKDLNLYWDLLNKGGILSGHDIQYVGVSNAVLEFAKEKKLEVHFGERRDWWIIKK